MITVPIDNTRKK